ncbi:MAG TPA: NAD(P)-dependent alcohol dehydrogenase [Stellaceae bacterium]|nr:NAD(P)-dependent alcohol dehydrogenase [Stellaceae bacterium]
MRAIELKAPGFDGLTAVELPVPTPGPGEILIELRAASVNYRDLMVVLGEYPAKSPVVPLSDGVGTIVELGAGVRRFKTGQRVCPVFAPGWASGAPCETTMARALGAGSDGVLRELMTLGADDAVLVPDHLSDEEAATLPCAALTAWSALVEFGRVRPGDVVLVEGTGGVALFALQFAKAAGARVAVVSSTDEKLARAQALGAEILVNYTAEPNWGQAVRTATGGRGVDITIELGGAATLPQAMAALAFGGRVAQVGILTGVDAQLPLRFVVPRAATLQGILVGSRTGFEAMAAAIAAHRLKPVIDRVLPFDRAGEAIEAMRKGSHFGKIALRYEA